MHLYNHGEKDFCVEKDMRIAQLLTLPINSNRYVVVDELSKSNRGENGFGSTDEEFGSNGIR